MNTENAIKALKQIEHLSSALHWLNEYGTQLKNGDTGQFTVKVYIAYARNCAGMEQAQYQLDTIAKWYIEQIVEHAIKDCENTICMLREQILREVKAI